MPDPLASALAALTPLRRAVYRSWWEQALAGQPPSKAVCAQAAGVSVAGVSSAIQVLATQGLLPRRVPGSHWVDPAWQQEAPGRLALLGEEGEAVVERAAQAVEVKGSSSGFSVPRLPSHLPPIEQLIQRRLEDHQRLHLATTARGLVEVKILLDGPIAITHLGDPHVDDDGCDLAALKRDIEIINRTEGMYGANVGDSNNNWTGRLGHLYGRQGTSAEEAWLLTEWLVKSVPWLYILAGNHGAWSGAGDPLNWLVSHAGVFEKWGARLNLKFPCGRQVRVNARHDFVGHSQWNTAHGVMKAAQMGWRDHILTCGHLHTSGYGLVKDPATGLISHAIRVAGYKRHDEYAVEKGLPNQSVSPSVTTIIDPQYADDDPRLVTVMWSTETAADYLTWKRAHR